MSGRRNSIVVGLFAANFFAAAPIHAQSVDGVRSSPGADLLKISATQPVQMQVQHFAFGPSPNYPNGFRVLFRINTADQQDAPIVAVGYGGLRADYIHGWTAFSSGAATCEVDRDKVRGISIFAKNIDPEWALISLNAEATSDTVASSTRPTVVSADFRCDGPIEAGDSVVIQMKLFVRNRYQWVPADFTFVDLPVVSR